ncbi:(d)CMP kinase [Clostridium sp. D2Q-14]|uniref:(d)CMP kinase n=1 Tax=Anaeromonas gelatinilytica TaxID=2683194 RepID=UPI00193C01D1|nr:(d)CMP kinase [Anaeromonas gelatinilytica]MBS4536254.1 (d)CMP kinase [Anaeromonas gelatinilytica]
MSNLVIAIDGPAGAGKSTVAKLIAQNLNIVYIDTGSMYRALTYKLLKENIDLNNTSKIIDVLNSTKIDFRDNHIFLDDEIVDDKIRTNKINNNVSLVAKIKEVREKLVKIQRNISKNNDIIMDGRDIGSYVLPNAKFKFYITANPEERGKRRYKELIKEYPNIKLSEIIEEIKERDKIDKTRNIAPLIKTEDSIEIDTTNKSIEEVVKIILNYIEKNNY